jgi:protein O-mannosyl-transferase
VSNSLKKEGLGRSGLVGLLLISGTLASYWEVWRFGFLSLDDSIYITANPAIAPGPNWKTIQWAFTTTWTGNRHPLT